MSSVLYSLGRWAFQARWLVLGLWVAVLAMLVAGAAAIGTGTDNTYRIPGTESQDALDALARTFPQLSGASAQLIAVAPDDTGATEGTGATDPAFEAAVEQTITELAAIPQVAQVSSPYAEPGSANLSPDGRAALVPIQLTVGTSSVTDDTSAALQQAGAELEAALPAGSEVSVGGQLFSQTATGISITELIGIAVALLVLVLTFRSLVAAGMPLVTALLGVGVSLAVVLAATRFVTVTSTTPLLALMLGLAVGIDYALFIISRHQDQVKAGVPPEESAARAVATSGSAVVFAATTVIIALVGLTVAGIPFLTTMGVAAAFAVAVAVAVSVTLTPALLGFARWRVVPRRFRPAAVANRAGRPDASGETDASGGTDTAPVPSPPPSRFFTGWVRGVTRWPIVTMIGIVGLLVLAAVPAAGLRLALPDAGSLDEAAPGRVTYDLVSEHFGPGFNGPLLVTGQIIQSTDPVGLMDDLATELAAVPGVASVPLATPNETGDTGVVQVIPDGGPDSEATKELVGEIRSMHDTLEAEYGVDLSVTGYTAAGIDISDRLAGALLPFGVLVVGLSLVLLAMVFRSIVVPVTAALGYALSIGAAFGLTSLVFVDGVFADALNVADVGTVISFMPIILMGVLFGLAMDYEVFLVTRMREEFVHHGGEVGAAGAVRNGFVASARVVTAAAIIMFAVFVAFVPEGDASIQPIAFGLAVGVAIDAFLVRMSLIPAVLVLFGTHAWWMPRALDRVLPRFDVEGEGLAAELALAEWPAGDGGELAAGAGAGARVGVRAAASAGVNGDADLGVGTGTGAAASVFAIAAERARVGAAPEVAVFDAMVPAGEVLVVSGGSAVERTAVLLALGGRVPVTAGRVKLAGLAVPPRGATVRRRSAYVDLAPDADGDPRARLHTALHSRPEIVMLDGVDLLGDEASLDEVRTALSDASRRSRHDGHPPLTLVVSSAAADVAAALIPAGMRVHRVELEPEHLESEPHAFGTAPRDLAAEAEPLPDVELERDPDLRAEPEPEPGRDHDSAPDVPPAGDHAAALGEAPEPGDAPTPGGTPKPVDTPVRTATPELDGEGALDEPVGPDGTPTPEAERAARRAGRHSEAGQGPTITPTGPSA
ncbi:MMPL family transporter [Agromyces aerolatus]|uniref:MMPL family transporter n=1 Tax=Agromyces sp. LY-1074 TaxID=3074080 RepID=UPI00285C80CA|nr:MULTISPECIES: MMPL family transporter [unclassified Agromyces]MDR5699653.1 MMPL family transporter [Agromyces sp. LY-1074]MDR5705949.1 MMPL family transporter [Agromyces sp. LY-1358]